MNGITKQQRDALLDLLIQYEELIAENQALRAILKAISIYGPFQNATWEEELERVMSSPVREEYRKAFAPILQRINSAFEDSELYRQLLKTPLRGLIN